MHLLVLGAFRPGLPSCNPVPPGLSQCTFWCLVLSDRETGAVRDLDPSVSMHLLVLGAFRPGGFAAVVQSEVEFQCTFWCLVLSDAALRAAHIQLSRVSMHLLVLGAFRPCARVRDISQTFFLSQCTFWCSVLSDLTTVRDCCVFRLRSQCTFWCLVLSDSLWGSLWGRLGCFNAPSGAWCFPTESPGPTICPDCVSMHLLVLGAFRLYPQKTAPQRRLLERNRRRPRKHRIRPAHTAPIKPHNRRKPPQTTPAPPTPPTHQYTTGFQQTQAKKPPPRTFGIVSDTGEKQARRNRPLTGLRQPDIIRRPTRTPPVLTPPPAC